MKYMKLGTKPDTFYTAEATRTMISDLPTDLTIHINDITYLLHKFPLLQKCHLLQQHLSEIGDAESATLELHDIPGGADAFELCAKFCYGIKIDLSALNFVPAICAAKFLQMTESVAKGNFISKLEFFFNSCILEGWKDSVVALQITERFTRWSENLGIIRRCIDSVVDKILTPPQKVRWSYTYTRPGYEQKKHHKSTPKDWWTEDIADLDIDLFRCVIITLRSANMLPPQLIGEALHVYASRWLTNATKDNHQPETSSVSEMTEEETMKRKTLEIIVSLIPEDMGSVSVGFLLRLLSMSKVIGASPAIKTQLIKKCGLQLQEVTLDNLISHSHDSSGDHQVYDIDLFRDVLEDFVIQWRKLNSRDESLLQLIRKVGKLVDSYLQVVSSDANISVQQVASLANALPEVARPEHDRLYKAINLYLNEHPQMTKEEKKYLCSILDCQKLSAAARAHAVKNERLPLRTIVQVLFFEHENHGGKATTRQKSQQSIAQHEYKEPTETTKYSLTRLHLGSDERSNKAEDARRYVSSSRSQRLEPESEDKSRGKEIEETGSDKVKEIIEENKQGRSSRRIQRSKSEHGGHKSK